MYEDAFKAIGCQCKEHNGYLNLSLLSVLFPNCCLRFTFGFIRQIFGLLILKEGSRIVSERLKKGSAGCVASC